MALYLLTNQHQPDDCPELSDELGSHYDVHTPSADVSVYCNCGAGEHRMFFVVDAASATGAVDAIPAGFTRTATTVTQVDQIYQFAAGD